ncbi:unnamed protein product [Bursaphelenchus okinawaensis]|uniref:Peptidylprolyl isomerase n=1 Tax=Bursaphelenchus okinawaensis TaxID=465554 RepID=A0A811JUB9_9BILA|nr:unnamed protein product [Bursaphelenchus okinawaensis]CAG9082933.1 unnamed protein product [Bursaphelenchus okinawaensis]
MSEEDNWIDVLENGEIFKRTLADSDGIQPIGGDLVCVTVECEHEHYQLEAPLGRGLFPDAFEIVLLMVKCEEKVQIRMEEERFKCSNFTLGDVEVPGSDSYIITLKSIAKDFDDTKYGSLYQSKGKEYYRAQDYPKAAQVYKHALVFNMSDEYKAKMVSNLCACYTQLKEWDEITKLTDDLVIPDSLDKQIVSKLKFRRGMALYNKKRYNEAIDEFKHALIFDKANMYIQSYIGLSTEKGRKQEQKLQKFYSGMMKEFSKEQTTKSHRFTLFSKAAAVVVIVIVVAVVIHYFFQ